MKPLIVVAFLPLILLALVFDLICALSMIGWFVILVRERVVTDDALDLLRSALD